VKSELERWFLTVALASGVVAACEGFGLVLGFLLVTVPGRAQQQLADQPGPTWVAVVGLALGAYGVVTVGLFFHVAKRRGKPLWASHSAKPRAWLESGQLWGAVAGAAFALPLMFVSVVSPQSALRPIPAAFGAMVLIVSVWAGRASTRA
jgi:hypothetical protein